MKKKFLSAILCVAMGVTMLAGCGSSGGNGGDSSQSASAKGDDSGEIYMFISQPEYADAIGELIDEYKKWLRMLRSIMRLHRTIIRRC